VLTKLRRSAGQDVDGGCGQLRARALAPDGAGGAAPAVTSRPAAAAKINTVTWLAAQ